MSRAVLFSHSMILWLRNHILAGLTGNADIARVLRIRYAHQIEAGDVARWRAQHPLFEAVCASAVDEMCAEMAGHMVEHARSGSESAARYLLDRRAPAFRPAQRVEHAGQVTTLEGMLRERAMTPEEQEADARARGLIRDA